jgi:hypothetical protein
MLPRFCVFRSIHILVHPRGSIYNFRLGLSDDWALKLHAVGSIAAMGRQYSPDPPEAKCFRRSIAAQGNGRKGGLVRAELYGDDHRRFRRTRNEESLRQ